MTKEAVQRQLQSDAIFALNFVADNNPNGAVAVLAENGYYMPSTEKDPATFVFNTLFELLSTNKQKCIEIVGQIPYNKSTDAPLYTQGLNDFFMRSTPANKTTAQGKFSLDALLMGLGTGLSTYSGVSLAGENGTGGYMPTAQQQAAQAAAAAEAKRKQTNLIIGLTVGGLIILGVVIYFATGKKNDDK